MSNKAYGVSDVHIYGELKCKSGKRERVCNRVPCRLSQPTMFRSLFDHVRWISGLQIVFLLFLVALPNAACEKEPVDFEDQQFIPKNATGLVDSKHHPEVIAEKMEPKADIGFIHAFVASISVIIVSELGDKTFFIAAIMAMKHPRLTVFSGAILALAVMTILSASLGGFAMAVIPRAYTFYISTALFAIFGLKMLKEGYSMQPHEAQEELEEVQAELRKRDDELEKQQKEGLIPDAEAGGSRGMNRRSRIFAMVSRIFLQSFTLTFLAEWGDRSQLTTIILAAREDAVGVTIGGIIGHALCTSLAVIGGRMIAQRISVRTVTLIGGVVFLIFAVSALFIDPNS